MPRFVQQCIRTVEARGTQACRQGSAPWPASRSKGWRPLGEHRVKEKEMRRS